MTDRCEDLSTRRRPDYSSTETSCEPSPEQTAAKETLAKQGAEREAEARRNAYFASGTDEGGRSSRASSDPSALQTSSKYDQRDKNAQLAAYYTHFDRPLQDDVVGNALIGAIGGGAVAGVRMAASGVEVAARTIVGAAADATAKSLVGTVRDESLKGAYEASRRGVELSPELLAPAAGRSSPKSTSETVREPVRTEAPRIPEQLPPLPFKAQG
jgi:hypothetical protein